MKVFVRTNYNRFTTLTAERTFNGTAYCIDLNERNNCLIPTTTYRYCLETNQVLKRVIYGKNSDGVVTEHFDPNNTGAVTEETVLHRNVFDLLRGYLIDFIPFQLKGVPYAWVCIYRDGRFQYCQYNIKTNEKSAKWAMLPAGTTQVLNQLDKDQLYIEANTWIATEKKRIHHTPSKYCLTPKSDISAFTLEDQTHYPRNIYPYSSKFGGMRELSYSIVKFDDGELDFQIDSKELTEKVKYSCRPDTLQHADDPCYSQNVFLFNCQWVRDKILVWCILGEYPTRPFHGLDAYHLLVVEFSPIESAYTLTDRYEVTLTEEQVMEFTRG